MTIVTDWTEVMSVGVPALDDDHRILLGVLAQLWQAVEEKEQPDVIGSMVIFFCDYVLTHLRREERLMQRLSYPDFAVHKEAHDAFSVWSSDFRRAYERSDRTALESDALAYPGKWWANHIMTLDMAYQGYFAARATEVEKILESEDLFEIYGFDQGEPVDDPFYTLSAPANA